MKKNIWLLVALIAVVFISGAAAGFFAGRLTAEKRFRRPHKSTRSEKNMRAMFEKRICKRLKLSDEQKKSAMPLIGNWLDEMDKLRREHAPVYHAAFSKFCKEITPILTPEQLVELDKMQKRFNKHKKKNKENPVDSSNPVKKGEKNVSK